MTSTSTMLAVCTFGIYTYVQKQKAKKIAKQAEAEAEAEAKANAEAKAEEHERRQDARFASYPDGYIIENFPRLGCIIDSGYYGREYTFCYHKDNEGDYTIKIDEAMLNNAGYTLDEAKKCRKLCAKIEEFIENNTTMQQAHDAWLALRTPA
jgi:hypothetical protein